MGDLTKIDGGGKPDEIRDAIRNMREHLPEFIERVQLIAKVQRAKFVALKQEGFTDEQALQLCKDV